MRRFLSTTVLILLVFALSFAGLRVNAGEKGHMEMEKKGHQEGAMEMEGEHGHVDDYLFWRVSEGGQLPPFNSAMPAFKGILSEDEIWQVFAYIHAFSHIKLLEHKPGEEIPGELPAVKEKEHKEEKGN